MYWFVCLFFKFFRCKNYSILIFDSKATFKDRTKSPWRRKMEPCLMDCGKLSLRTSDRRTQDEN